MLWQQRKLGLKIVTKFKKDTVLSLCSMMTLRMWSVLKRLFSSEVGWDVFGSVDDMNKELKQMEFQYKCWTFTPSTGIIVHFVHVQDVRVVVVQLSNELRKAGQMQHLHGQLTRRQPLASCCC